MRAGKSIQQKIVSLAEARQRIEQGRILNRTVAFTNGCFDILHAGHIASLSEAAGHADLLVVGLNGDASIRGLKGPGRPVNDQQSRALLMASLAMVDFVVIFDEPTPIELIKALRPDFLVKGGDYKVEDIAGAKEVLGWGGKVIINPIVEGFSTTGIIEKMKGTAGS